MKLDVVVTATIRISFALSKASKTTTKLHRIHGIETDLSNLIIEKFS